MTELEKMTVRKEFIASMMRNYYIKTGVRTQYMLWIKQKRIVIYDLVTIVTNY
jgi:hypothetical protein